MNEIVLLDDSYLNPEDAPCFHTGKRVILRRVNDENGFLVEGSLREQLISSGVVPYVESTYNSVPYLEIEPFFFPNSPSNWSYSMYRDCLLLLQKLNDSLMQIGYSLIDGHCFNVVFYYHKPVFVDLGSINQGNTNQGMAELSKYKKALFSYRTCSAPHTRKKLDSEIEAPSYLDTLMDLVAPDYFVNWRNRLLRILGLGGQSTWRHYYTETPESYSDIPKESVIRHILATMKPATVYDIGCNSGHFSFIAEASGARVVACDPDPDCIDYLYNTLKGGERKILPLVADLDGFLRAIERSYQRLRPVRVDMVFMLALIHHLVYRVGLVIEDIFERVARMGAESLLIEFVSIRDDNVRAWNAQNPREWYTLEHLCAVGNRYFEKYELYEAHDKERPIVLFSGRKHL